MTDAQGHPASALSLRLAVSEILPASFKAATIASLVIAVIRAGALAFGELGVDGDSVATVIMAFLVVFLSGLLAGNVACAFFLSILALPMALVLKGKASWMLSFVLAAVASLAIGLAATQWAADALNGLLDSYAIVAIAALYGILAGHFYRRGIILARISQPWDDRVL